VIILEFRILQLNKVQIEDSAAAPPDRQQPAAQGSDSSPAASVQFGWFAAAGSAWAWGAIPLVFWRMVPTRVVTAAARVTFTRSPAAVGRSCQLPTTPRLVSAFE